MSKKNSTRKDPDIVEKSWSKVPNAIKKHTAKPKNSTNKRTEKITNSLAHFSRIRTRRRKLSIMHRYLKALTQIRMESIAKTIKQLLTGTIIVDIGMNFSG
mmetsp:Transcript_30160/g.48655  ORF Transcript_30160/g.48655 Transcript_30160/m.48655 type:complete len:101 (+) Transcript_30160:1251-1553(+)